MAIVGIKVRNMVFLLNIVKPKMQKAQVVKPGLFTFTFFRNNQKTIAKEDLEDLLYISFLVVVKDTLRSIFHVESTYCA
jgi:hypothetical protein